MRQLNVTVVIRNEGDANAGSFETKLYLIQYQNPTKLFLGRISTRSLNADDGTTIRFTTALPSNVGIVPSVNRYWFLAEVDPDDHVEESDDHPIYRNDITTSTKAIYAP